MLYFEADYRGICELPHDTHGRVWDQTNLFRFKLSAIFPLKQFEHFIIIMFFAMAPRIFMMAAPR
jgi:hypothetical protein